MVTRILADLFCLDLKTPENPNGTYNVAELYKYIIDVRIFGFNNDDPGLALQRRKWAREGAESLTKTTLKVVSNLPASEKSGKGIVKGAVSTAKSIASKIPLVGKLVGDGKGVEGQSTSGSLRWYGYNVAKELIASGKTPAEVADISWMNAVGGVGATIGVVRTPGLRKVVSARVSADKRSSLPMSSTISSRMRTPTTGKRFRSLLLARTWNHQTSLSGSTSSKLNA